MSRLLLICIAVILSAAACTPSLSISDANAIVADGNALLLHQPEGQIDKSKWTSTIAGLNPENVRSSPEGLYIITHEFFVDQKGFFVPRRGATIPYSSTGDPSYDPLPGGLFWYHSRG